MQKRVQLAVAVLLIMLAGMLVWQLQRVSEPVYQGKRLSQWLWSYSADVATLQPEIDRAIRGMGTNAVPILLEKVQVQDSPMMLRLRDYRWFWRLGLH